MPWTPYRGSNGPTVPYFPQTTTYVVGVPINSKGNLYSPSNRGGKTNQVSRPGGMTPAGSKKLKFS